MRCTRTASKGEEVEGGCWFTQGKMPGKYSQRPGPGHPQTSDSRPALKTTRSPGGAHRLQQDAALTRVASWSITKSLTRIQLGGMEVRGVYPHAALPHYQGA